MEMQITPEILHSLPMTTLEIYLKEYWYSRPDLQDKVLAAADMIEYFHRLSEKYGNMAKEILAQDALAPVIRSGVVGDVANRLRSNPGDKSILQDLSAVYAGSSETHFFAESEDISAALTLRYMPANWEENSYFEVYYGFSGSCPMMFADESVALHPGTVLLIPPNTRKAYACSADNCVLLFCKIRSSTFSKVFWSHLSNQNLMSYFFRQALSGNNSISYLKFDVKQDPEIERILCALYNEYRKQGIYRPQILHTLMSLFFLRLLTDYESSAQLSQKSNFLLKPEYLQILRYIQTNFITVTQDELTRKYNYSNRQIIRIIQSCTGMNLTQLLTKLRMEKAASLIVSQSMPFTQVAAEVGYSTLSSFYRAFGQYFQCTPKQYQLRNK